MLELRVPFSAALWLTLDEVVMLLVAKSAAESENELT